MKDPYSILGIRRDASENEIKSAYKKLAKKYHPDVMGNNEDSERKMQEINAAYDSIMKEKNDYNPFRQESGFTNEEDDLEYRAAYNYIRYHRFTEALNALSGIKNRGAKYYYLTAVAYAGLDDLQNARINAEYALKLEPNNLEYQNLVAHLQRGRYSYQERQFTYPKAPNFGFLCFSVILTRLCCFWCF